MIERRTIETSSGRISYLDTNTNKPKFIYVHGAFGGLDTLVNLINHFGFDRFRFITPSLPGNDSSYKLPESYSYTDVVTSMVEFLDQINIENAVLVGHSLGGRVVLDILSKKDLKIKIPVLISPVLEPLKSNFVQTMFNSLNDFGHDVGFGQVENIQKFDNPFRISQIGNLKKVWQFLHEVDTIAQTNLNIEPIILWGKNDTTIPMKLDLISKINSRLVMTYNGGHYWFLGNMNCFNDINEYI